MCMESPMMRVDDIMALGLTKSASYTVLRQAKHVMVERGFEFYTSKRLGAVPSKVVREILGLELVENG